MIPGKEVHYSPFRLPSVLLSHTRPMGSSSTVSCLALGNATWCSPAVSICVPEVWPVYSLRWSLHSPWKGGEHVSLPRPLPSAVPPWIPLPAICTLTQDVQLD